MVLSDEDKWEWHKGQYEISRVEINKWDKIKQKKAELGRDLTKPEIQAYEAPATKKIKDIWQNFIKNKTITNITVPLKDNGAVDYIDFQAGMGPNGMPIMRPDK